MKKTTFFLVVLLSFSPVQYLHAEEKEGSLWDDWFSGRTGGDAREATANTMGEVAGQITENQGKRVTASGMRKVITGNNKVRSSAASKFNLFFKNLENVAGKHMVKYAGIYTTAADSASTVLGHYYEGDYSGGSAVAVNEAAKAGASTAGAASFAYAGATAGTFIGGPPGTIIGGAVGAVVGAVAGSSAYNYLVGDKLKKLAEYSFSEPEIDPLEQARRARAEAARRKKERESALKFLDEMEKENISIGDFWDETGNKGESEVGLKSDFPGPSEILGKSKPPPKKASGSAERKKEVKQQKKDLMKKAERMDQTINPSAEHASVPVIEQNCTIDAVIWLPENPEYKTDVTYYIQSGKFTFNYESTLDGNSNSTETTTYNCNSLKTIHQETGILQGNVIRAQGKGHYYQPQHCVTTGTRSEKHGEEWIDVPYRCESEYNATWEDTAVITFHSDGTLTIDSTSRHFPTMKVWGDNCPWDEKAWTDSWKEHGVSKPNTFQMVGIWSKRE